MRYFKGTVKCGFCGKKLSQDDIKEYYPNPDNIRDDDLKEEQCPYCGYHADVIENEYDPFDFI